MKRRLFGTDGIRGVAGQSPLSERDVRLLGRCAGIVLREKTKKPSNKILIVRDTRRSGASLSKALSTGLREVGIDVFNAGVLSTPSAAHLVQAHKFDSGVVISASHNPPKFNGIKFFNNHGRKWADEWEFLVEEKYFSGGKCKKTNYGKLIEANALAVDYEGFLIDTLPNGTRFSGLRIAMDCSHGATYRLAPAVFKELGAEVILIGAQPNGANINVDCGSQHTEKLAKTVVKHKCDMGIAFDGDGDRVIVVDEKGTQIDGDYIIAILAKAYKADKALKNNTVVITVMANLGLKKALSGMKIKTQEVSVGDRYVSEAMKKTGAILGGEQSGHIILGQHLPTGDGLLTALHLVTIYAQRNHPFSKLSQVMRKFPQVLKNMTIEKRIPLEELPGVMPVIKRIEKTLGSNGRVLIRYSGTEPLLRIMLEGPKKDDLEKYAQEISTSVKKGFLAVGSGV